ncbi:metallophosphoesterase [Candidatus Woesearchaeota archaeon]|nr:metallophosphoesterase [Candidatus Woesearchaeota archaeon]
MKESTINFLNEKQILVSPDILDKNYDEEFIKKIIETKKPEFLDEETIQKYIEENKNKNNTKVNIIKSYDKEPKKRTFQDFVSVFNNRFKKLSELLKNRKELDSTTSISRLNTKNQNDKTAIIGMILDKQLTKNNNIILTLEDTTGTCNAIIRKTDDEKEIYETAENIVLDEVIGITGTYLNKAIFVDKIIFPDIPLNKELKKQKEEEYAIMIGDTHFGSNHFMKEDFERFIKWINQELGNEEQKKIASKVKYAILTGDIVEGVGIYPNQEKDLDILNIVEQYEEAARWLKKIPEHIQIITQSGNHDAGRLSEPQEAPFKDMAKPLWDLPNITLVSNPAYVNIGKTETFPGFDLLLYHGGSLIYYADNIPKIRAAGGQKKSDQIMKHLLQKRHLAPTHKSTLYLPDAEEDFLLIDIVPDFFITGHIHRSNISSYRNITIINASCWTETTEDQIKRGLEPLPARIPIVNLKTRDVKIINFLSKKSKEKEKEVTKEVEELKKLN